MSAEELTVAEAERIDGLADTFERTLKAGGHPSAREVIETSGLHGSALAALEDELEALEDAYRAALGPGDVLGTYRVLERIGRGGMGEVYRAHDDALGRDVAIKVLRRTLAGDAGAHVRFVEEARALAALSHPNVVTVFDFGEEREVRYFVTELLEGETLRERIRRGPLHVAEAVEIARALAAGLAAAHAKGIVHRDLKPENVFLPRDGGARLLDFGLAGAAPGDRIAGSRPYMAPEQAEGSAGPSSDLFALGLVLFEMLAGHRPEARVRLPRVPRALERLVAECLAADPARRPKSAAEVLERLRTLRSAPRFRRPVWAGIAALVVAGVLLRPQAGVDTRYLQGRRYLDAEDKADLGRAVASFEAVIAAEPRNAEAYASLAAGYLALSGTHLPPVEALAKAKDAAARALELDPSNAEALAAAALVRVRGGWDWAGAEADLRRAVAADPRSAAARQALGHQLALSGRTEEALRALEAALAIDPLRRSAEIELGATLLYARRYPEARERFLRVLTARPDAFLARWGLGEVELATGDAEGAIRELEAARRLDDDPEVDGELALALARAGQLAEARRVRDGLVAARTSGRRSYVSPTAIALASAAAGDTAAAFDWLERAVEERDEWLLYLTVDPSFDGLRADPRFEALRRRTGPAATPADP